ncbi:MAG: hypothetical protein WCP12_17190, partial [bacterium]
YVRIFKLPHSLHFHAAAHMRCRQCHKRTGLSGTNINNIWTAFVVTCSQLLSNDGVMGLVLPADLLQVKYAEQIRMYLENSFERLEIMPLGTEMFPNIEQQTIALFAYKKSLTPGTYFYKVEDYETCRVSQTSSNGLMISQSKWTHYNLATVEIALLNSVAKKFGRVDDFIKSKPGIVTGANDFFIISEKEVKKYNASVYARPIISCGRSLEQGAAFTEMDFKRFSAAGNPSYLLDLRQKRPNKALDEYLQKGEEQGLPKRYKCSRRTPWYVIPCIDDVADTLFFKRTHRIPKFIKNKAQVFVTDTAYMVAPKTGFSIDDFIWSFYNPLTLIYAELTGRSYGGGVLELTPNEFRQLPIPYFSPGSTVYSNFARNLSFNDPALSFLTDPLRVQQLGVTVVEYKTLCDIYKSLINQRIETRKRDVKMA